VARPRSEETAQLRYTAPLELLSAPRSRGNDRRKLALVGGIEMDDHYVSQSARAGWQRRIGDLLNITASDEGRPITDFTPPGSPGRPECDWLPRPIFRT
jgi:hypothetical protein